MEKKDPLIIHTVNSMQAGSTNNATLRYANYVDPGACNLVAKRILHTEHNTTMLAAMSLLY